MDKVTESILARLAEHEELGAVPKEWERIANAVISNFADTATPAQAEPSVPEGYVLVPVRPTDEMHSVMLDWGTKKSEWEAILAAAPKNL